MEVFRVSCVEVDPLHLHSLHATRKPVPESEEDLNCDVGNYLSSPKMATGEVFD